MPHAIIYITCLQESFTISDGIEGSATSYTITYRDSTYNGICGSATIPASSCVGGMCSHTFEASTSVCPPLSDVNVTVFGTTQLGDGAVSNPVTVGQSACVYKWSRTHSGLYIAITCNVNFQVPSIISLKYNLIS